MAGLRNAVRYFLGSKGIRAILRRGRKPGTWDLDLRTGAPLETSQFSYRSCRTSPTLCGTPPPAAIPGQTKVALNYDDIGRQTERLRTETGGIVARLTAERGSGSLVIDMAELAREHQMRNSISGRMAAAFQEVANGGGVALRSHGPEATLREVTQAEFRQAVRGETGWW